VRGAGGRENAGADNTVAVKSCAVVLTGCFCWIGRRTAAGDVCVTCRCADCVGTARRAPGLTLFAAGAGRDTFAGRLTFVVCDGRAARASGIGGRETAAVAAAAAAVAAARAAFCDARAAVDPADGDGATAVALAGIVLIHSTGMVGSTCVLAFDDADAARRDTSAEAKAEAVAAVTAAEADDATDATEATARFVPPLAVEGGRHAVGR
jgi:hypothetical protein